MILIWFQDYKVSPFPSGDSPKSMILKIFKIEALPLGEGESAKYSPPGHANITSWWSWRESYFFDFANHPTLFYSIYNHSGTFLVLSRYHLNDPELISRLLIVHDFHHFWKVCQYLKWSRDRTENQVAIRKSIKNYGDSCRDWKKSWTSSADSIDPKGSGKPWWRNPP